jgi:hypothetical protein
VTETIRKPPAATKTNMRRTGIDVEGYMLPVADIVRRAREARELGATEVCIQAGLPPNMPPDLYERCAMLHSGTAFFCVAVFVRITLCDCPQHLLGG